MFGATNHLLDFFQQLEISFAANARCGEIRADVRDRDLMRAGLDHHGSCDAGFNHDDMIAFLTTDRKAFELKDAN